MDSSDEAGVEELSESEFTDHVDSVDISASRVFSTVLQCFLGHSDRVH